MQVAVELYLFFSRQSSSLRPIRQLQHSLPVAFPKVDRQQEFGGLGGQFTLLRLHQAGPNSRLRVWTESCEPMRFFELYRRLPHSKVCVVNTPKHLLA